MVDLAITALLLFLFARSIRARLPVGALLSALAIAHLVVTTVLVARSLGTSTLAIPFGLIALGPSALGELVTGPAHAFVHPLATAFTTTLLPAIVAIVALRRTVPLHPDMEPARALTAAGRIAVAASSLSAIRVVTYFLFLAVVHD